MTMVMPWSMTAGSWKQRDFPKEVAAWTKTSEPERAASIMSFCIGLPGVRGQAVAIIYLRVTYVLYLKLSLPNWRRNVNSGST